MVDPTIVEDDLRLTWKAPRVFTGIVQTVGVDRGLRP